MKKWKIIKIITIIALLAFIMFLVLDTIICMNMKYPHPMLGMDAYTWIDQFKVDLMIIFIYFGIPLIVDIILLIVAITRTKK